jgi:GR25 family glycosyltransferase involved in LPS biosynthesis
MAWNLDQIPVVCLNLDRRPDRWERVQNFPGYADFPKIQRWPAVDGKTIDILNDERVSVVAKHNIQKKTRRAHEYLNTPGAIGCYLSHTSVYEWLAKQNDTDVVLIFEDDIALPAGCYQALKAYVAANKTLQDATKWDVWQLGPWISEGVADEAAGAGNSRILSYQLAHAYLVSKRGAAALLKQIHPIELHIDGYMSFLSQIGQLDMFGSNVQLFSQNGSSTDIHIGLACPVCDVPDNFNINSMLISKRENLLYKMAAGAGTIAVLYIAWRLITKPPKNRA